MDAKYYYSDIAKVEKLSAILKEWDGTPYRHHVGVKQLGCDCIHFVGCVLDEMGVVDFHNIRVPNYPRDWHLHNTREMLLENFLSRVNCEEVSLKALEDGDIIFSHYGQAASHSAIYLSEYCWQSLAICGVVKIHISDRAMKRQMRYAYRILA